MIVNMIPSWAEILCGLRKCDNFEGFYEQICNKFNSWNRLQVVCGESCESLRWPEGIGVYLIRRKEGDGEVVYVGMTGKIIRSTEGEVGLADNTDGFKKRSQRWHPYCFTKSGNFENHFEYGPNFNVNDLRCQPEEKRYKNHIPIGDIEADCFVLGKGSMIAPAFLESLILQSYFSHKGTLPVGNNQF